jgi:hypothetical protein
MYSHSMAVSPTSDRWLNNPVLFVTGVNYGNNFVHRLWRRKN